MYLKSNRYFIEHKILLANLVPRSLGDEAEPKRSGYEMSRVRQGTEQCVALREKNLVKSNLNYWFTKNESNVTD